MAGEDDKVSVEFEVVDDPAITAIENVSEAAVRASQRAAEAGERAAQRATERAAEAARAAQMASARSARASARAAEEGSGAAKRAAERAVEAMEKANRRAVRSAAQASAAIKESWAKAAQAQALAAARASQSTKIAGGTSFSDIAKKLNQNQLISDLEQVSAIFIQFGGNVSKAAAVTTSLIRPLALVGTVASTSGTAMAALGVGAAALAGPLALGATWSALNAVAGSAIEAEKELKKLGQEYKGPGKQALDEYQRATAQLTIELDKLKIEALAPLIHELAVITTAAQGAGSAYLQLAGASYKVYHGLTSLLTLGLAPVTEFLIKDTYYGFTETARAAVKLGDDISKAIERISEATKAAADASNEMERIAQQDEAEGKRQNDLAKERTRLAKEAAREAEEAARKRTQLLEGNEREITKLAEAERKAMLAENERAIMAIAHAEHQTAINLRFIRGLHSLERAYVDMGEAAEAAYGVSTQLAEAYFDSAEYRAAVFAEKLGDLNKTLFEGGQGWKNGLGAVASELEVTFGKMGQIFAPYADMIGTIFDTASQRAEELHDQVERHHNRVKKLREKQRETEDAGARARLEQEITHARILETTARAASERARSQQLRLWRADKAAKISQATMAGFLAIVQTYAQLGPIGGSLALPGVLGATGAQIAAIAKQPAPVFHTGGRFGDNTAPDEMNARVLRNEGAVTQRGMSTLGDEGLAALNAGVPLVAQITIVNQVEGKEVNRTTSTQTVKATPRVNFHIGARGR